MWRALCGTRLRVVRTKRSSRPSPRPWRRAASSAARPPSEYNKIQDALDPYDTDFRPSYLADDRGVGEAEEADYGKPGGSVFAQPEDNPRYVSSKDFALAPARRISRTKEPTPILPTKAPIEDPSVVVQKPPPPVYLGGLNLSYDSWVPELDAGLLVEFSAASVRRLGLVQGPKGKRNWLVLDDAGDERKVNKYHIYFQFPRPAGSTFSLFLRYCDDLIDPQCGFSY